ncbi:iron uptake porin [uncultured Thermosynechococcus sp.]|uniref:iron uptake porin n=1 Tax=uncultured Thermosynechococcus sp. TaxID=436945 RepID=UPI0026299F31|nr:iron uptake porin [uncultured Thermosynechococcus sp.]
MSQNVARWAVGSPVVLSLLATGGMALANPAVPEPTQSLPSKAEIEQSLGQQGSLPQVTSVSQLSDVNPTDWAYQALASLVEKYGCIAGYPDGTFRGNRAATRYEMAAALNACLDVISDRFATKEDLEALRRLTEEFKAELATLRGRVDKLEARTAQLEAQQFATLTKLNATVIFNISDANDITARAPGVVAPPPVVNNTNPVANQRTRLNFDTSFYGKDRLRLRLEAANIQQYDLFTNTDMGRLGYDGNTGNAFQLGKAFYSFPVTSKGRLILDFVRGEFNDNFNNFNPFLQSSDTGALSRFGRFNPIYRAGSGANAAGVSFKYDLISNKEKGTGVTLNLGYLAPNSQNPNANATAQGFLDGAYAALAQVDVQPVKNLALGLTYVHSFGLDPFAATGSTGPGSAANPLALVAVTRQAADSLGFQFTYRPIQKLNIAGWVGYARPYRVIGAAGRLNGIPVDVAEVLNWAVTLASPDLWRKGDLAGLVFGQPPQVIRFIPNVPTPPGNPSLTAFNSYHVEGFYRFAVSKNLSITPGIIAVFNPNSNPNNNTLVIGAIRTTFSF